MRIIAVGWLVALVACSLPSVGLWSSAGHANTGLFELYGRHFADGRVPYRSGFTFEYPPGAIPPLAVPALPGGSYVPWFHAFEFVCLLVVVAAVAVVRPSWLSVLAAAVAPALLGQLALNSFDLWTSALAAVAVALLATGRPRAGFAFLALSASAKLFPGLLAPALYLYVARRHGRALARRALGVGTVVFVIVFLPFAAVGPGGLRFSLQEQLTRGLQVESFGGSLFGIARQLGAASVHVVVATTPFSYDIAGRGATVVAAISSVLVLVAAYFVWRALRAGPIDLDRTLLAVAATAVAFVAFAKVLSPQYLLFLVPLVPLVRLVLPIGLYFAALALTQVWARFPEPFAQVSGLQRMIWVTFARNLVLIALFFDLFRRLSALRTNIGPGVPDHSARPVARQGPHDFVADAGE